MNRVIAMLAVSMGRRLGEERGQTAAEVLGMIVVVAAVIAVVVGQASTIGDSFVGWITDLFDRVGNSG